MYLRTAIQTVGDFSITASNSKLQRLQVLTCQFIGETNIANKKSSHGIHKLHKNNPLEALVATMILNDRTGGSLQPR